MHVSRYILCKENQHGVGIAKRVLYNRARKSLRKCNLCMSHPR